MRPWNNSESQRGAGSIQKCLKLRTATAVKAKPTLKWAWWMCVRFCGNPEMAAGKPVAVSEEREGVTLDLAKWDFNKADCRTGCRKLIENSKPLLLMDHRSILMERTKSKLGRFCTWRELYKIQVSQGRYFLHTHSHSAESWDRPTVFNRQNSQKDLIKKQFVFPVLHPRHHPRVLSFVGVFLPRAICALLCYLVQNRCFYPARPFASLATFLG